MPARLGPVASEILRRIMELSCIAGGGRRAAWIKMSGSVGMKR